MDVSSLNSGGVSRRRLFLGLREFSCEHAVRVTRFGFDAGIIPRYGRNMSDPTSPSTPLIPMGDARG